MKETQAANGNGSATEAAEFRRQIAALELERDALRRQLMHLHGSPGKLSLDGDVADQFRDKIKVVEEERDRLRSACLRFEQDFETRYEIKFEGKAAVIERTVEKEVKRLVWGSITAVLIVLSLAGTFGLKDVLPVFVRNSVKTAIDSEFSRIGALKTQMQIQTEEASTEAVRAKAEAIRVKESTDSAIEAIESEKRRLESLAAGARAQLASLFTASGQIAQPATNDEASQNAATEQTEKVDPEVAKALKGSPADATLNPKRQGWVWMGNDSDGKGFTTNFDDLAGAKVKGIELAPDLIYVLNESLRLRDEARTGKTLGFFPSGTYIRPLGRAVQKGQQWWIQVEEAQRPAGASR